MLTLGDLPAWFLRAIALALGLVWGSFLNVVIYRVPRNLSVVRPASRCPGCGTPIRAWQNVPVVGWVLLGGKARCCGVKISARYPLVELIGGVLAVAVLETAVLRMGPNASIARGAAIFVAELAFVLALVAAAFIDLEHMYIPDPVGYGGAVLGVATASFRGMTFVDALVGAAAGFAIVWLPFIVIYPRIRGGKVGMGLGDAKLLLASGAWLGWWGALIVLGAGAVQGTIAAILTLAARGKLEEPEAVRQERAAAKAELEAMSPEERAEAEKDLAEDPLADDPDEGVGQARIAFGPFLILATLECLLVGRDVIERWITP